MRTYLASLLCFLVVNMRFHEQDKFCSLSLCTTVMYRVLLVATLMAYLVLWLNEVNCTVLMYYLMYLWLSVTSLLQLETVKMMWQMIL